MRILLDIDDTLYDSTPLWVAIFSELAGRRVAPLEVTYPGFYRAFGLDRPAFDALIERRYHAASAIAANEPMVAAAWALGRWAAAGHEIVVATDRSPATRAATLAWLRRWRIPFARLILGRGLDKAALAADLGCRLAIDDRPAQLEALATVPGLRLASIRQRTNETYLMTHPGILAARNWVTLARRLERIEPDLVAA